MGLYWSFKYWLPGSNMKKVKELNISKFTAAVLALVSDIHFMD